MKKITKQYIQDKYNFLDTQFGIECGPGWFKLLDNLFFNIQKEIDRGKIDGFKITQVKEKYGTLRVYSNFGNKKIDKLIEIAEAKSSITCELCGKKGSLRTIGWLTTLCGKCYKEAREAK